MWAARLLPAGFVTNARSEENLTARSSVYWADMTTVKSAWEPHLAEAEDGPDGRARRVLVDHGS